MIERLAELTELTRLLRRYPVVGIVGVRQVGKTTLARVLAKRDAGPTRFLDLESPEDLARLADPLLTLRSPRSKGTLLID